MHDVFHEFHHLSESPQLPYIIVPIITIAMLLQSTMHCLIIVFHEMMWVHWAELFKPRALEHMVDADASSIGLFFAQMY